MSGVLEVTGLTVDYRVRGGQRAAGAGQAGRRPRSIRAVDGVDLSLTAGRTVALVGESGSGKSTVVLTLARFVRPAAGEIRLNGSASVPDRAYRRSLSLVFQDPFASLNPMHTVGHHLRRPLVIAHGSGDVEQRMTELLTSVSLVPAADVASKRPHELSGGQRQRVAIARALATDPDVLLADEPVSMLDVSIRLEILALLDRLREERNLAMLYVTHDLATARHFAAEILVMYGGQIVERGTSDRVILSPAHPYTQLLASSAPRPGARRRGRAADGRRPAGPAGPAGGCVFRPRCPHAMPVCATQPPDLPVPGDGVARCWLLSPDAAGH
jgi:peptide/nickel transport system ATP-binding protein